MLKSILPLSISFWTEYWARDRRCAPRPYPGSLTDSYL
jgi:hypothetical protein